MRAAPITVCEMRNHTGNERFYGWTVARAAFALAALGWGLGFYAPPVFLGVIHASTGWPLSVVSAAVTMHFLVGALVAANLPACHRRLGTVRATLAGTCSIAAGLTGWAAASAPWQLFVAGCASGIGWGTLGASALNAFVSPWFVRARPRALALAYNGASAGGIVFAPLWVASIAACGFLAAAAAIGAAAVAAVYALTRVLRRNPDELGTEPDGGPTPKPDAAIAPDVRHPVQATPWLDRRFVTLFAGMALGLFAQIGVTAHLYSLLVPWIGEREAAAALSLMTVMAIAGRTVVGMLLQPAADRRLVACTSYAAQALGCAAMAASGGTDPYLLFGGVILFGAGFGNATSLPPLIAQREFHAHDVERLVALAIGGSQALYAFAPVLFGMVRSRAGLQLDAAWLASVYVFAAAALIQLAAIAALLYGRASAQRPGRNPNTRSKRST